MMSKATHWSGRRVFITGHTGFKGAWMSLLLQRLGAVVAGYALPPPTSPSLFTIAGVENGMESSMADIRDLAKLQNRLGKFAPDLVIHLAAQSLVRESYEAPVETFAANVMGTVNLLEAVRHTKSVKAVVVVTSDKCYENNETGQAYVESDPMGGHDPYSASKGCTELATAAFAKSFFKNGACSVASVRAGNVVGGGDWAKDRLVPDIIRGLMAQKEILIRNPDATRPWQHVLEPLHGYLYVAAQLLEKGPLPWEGWNFGPDQNSEQTVETVARHACTMWGQPELLAIRPDPNAVHEATLLRLNSAKAKTHLGWAPRWDFHATLDQTMRWYKHFAAKDDMKSFTLAQIDAYRETLS